MPRLCHPAQGARIKLDFKDSFFLDQRFRVLPLLSWCSFNLLLWPCCLLNLWRWRQPCICHFELCKQRWQSSCSCPDVEPDWSKTWSQLLRCSMIFRSTPSTTVSWTLYTIRNYNNLGSKLCWYSHVWNFPRSPDLSVVFNHPYAFSSVLWMLLLSLSHRSLCCHLIKLG